MPNWFPLVTELEDREFWLEGRQLLVAGQCSVQNPYVVLGKQGMCIGNVGRADR